MLLCPVCGRQSTVSWSVSRRRTVITCSTSVCEWRFVANKRISSLALADEPSTNVIFRRSTRGKLDLAVTEIGPLAASSNVRMPHSPQWEYPGSFEACRKTTASFFLERWWSERAPRCPRLSELELAIRVRQTGRFASLAGRWHRCLRYC